MPTTDLLLQSQLAQAAYAANLVTIDSETFAQQNSNAYKQTEMSTAQAQSFSAMWGVAAQFSDSLTGLSVTVFADRNTDKRYLAIRGTEASEIMDLVADGVLAMGVPGYFNPQLLSLTSQVNAWLNDGTLDASFSVAGHSLGGYLAVALKQTLPTGVVTDAYTFNSPGDGGAFGNVASFFESLFGSGMLRTL